MASREEIRDLADALVLRAAMEHEEETRHSVRITQGVGWACEVCDPDLIAQSDFRDGFFDLPWEAWARALQDLREWEPNAQEIMLEDGGNPDHRAKATTFALSYKLYGIGTEHVGWAGWATYGVGWGTGEVELWAN